MTMRQDIGGDNWNVDREANQGDIRTSCIKDKQFGGQEDFRSGKKRMEGLEEEDTRGRGDQRTRRPEDEETRGRGDQRTRMRR